MMKRWTWLFLASTCLFWSCTTDDSSESATFRTEDQVDQSSDLLDMRSDASTEAEEGDVGNQNSDFDTEESEDLIEDEVEESLEGCPTVESPWIEGMIYEDRGKLSETRYQQHFDPEEDLPLSYKDIHLLSTDGEISTQSCENGAFIFGSLEAGTYVVDVDWDLPCTTANHAVRFSDAIRTGHVVVLTFGDSIPAYGETPYFPEQFADLVNGLAEVDNRNVAIPGSRAVDWLPESQYFEAYIVPNLSEADVIVFSLGGNDLREFAEGADQVTNAEELDAFIESFEEKVSEVEGELQTIAEAIKTQAPNADLVWFLYPNYAYSQEWEEMTGDYASLVQIYLNTTLEKVRKDMSEVPGLLIVDMLAAIDRNEIDQYLVDPLHLNVEGHGKYARELFYTLGGVLIGEEVEGTPVMQGFVEPSPATAQ